MTILAPVIKLLKKLSMTLSTSKKTVHPCTAPGLPKIRVFRQPGALLLALFLAGCAKPGPGFSISNAEVFAPAPGRTTSVAYLTIENHRDELLTVTRISSPQYARVEMHETVLDNGVARMRALPSLAVEGNTTVELKAGGKHLMLFSPGNALLPGKPVALHIHLASADSLIVETTLKTRHSTD